MHYDVIVYVLVIDFLAIMSPGPDFFMVLKNSLTISLKAGVYTTLGIALGSNITFTIGLFGLGIVVASSKLLFTIIKVIGAAYLIYLAIKSLLATVRLEEPQLVYAEPSLSSLGQYFKIGLLCNLSNPKAFMFVVALSTYAIKHGSTNLDNLCIVLVSGINTIIWFTCVACLFGTVKVRQVFYQNQRWINIIFAIILFYVAIQIIVF